MTKRCNVCLSEALGALIDFGDVPRSGYLLPSARARPPSVRLAFDYCHRCGLIQQQPSGGQTIVADYSYVNRRTERQLPEYADTIIHSLKSNPAAVEQLIIEVGANDGTFLNELARNGFRRLVAVEPSKALATICRDAGHAVENLHLDETTARAITSRRGRAKVVVCRHTLEHVPDPVSLLQSMRQLLDEEGMLFVEVPDSTTIFDNLRGYELWDEHVHGFTTSSLEVALERAGLEAARTLVLTHRHARNVLAWAHPTVTRRQKTRSNGASVQLGSFARRWRDYAKSLAVEAESWKRPVLAIGASHPQTNFLLFTGLGQHTCGFIDDDQSKIGLYAAVPEPQPIFSSAQISEKFESATILMTAFGYEAWMQELRKTLPPAKYQFVDPLRAEQRYGEKNSA